jgi:phosphopantetheine adenylyltransferase
LAIDLYKNIGDKHDGDEAYYLQMLMEKRRDMLNKNFIWTDESREKIIRLNDKFYQNFKKAYDEALLVSDEMKKELLEIFGSIANMPC